MSFLGVMQFICSLIDWTNFFGPVYSNNVFGPSETTNNFYLTGNAGGNGFLINL